MPNSYADSDRAIERAIVVHTPRCRVCRTGLPEAARWCSRCGVNTMSHVHGRLASPMRRLSATVLDYTVPVAAVIATSSLSNGADVLELVLLAYAPCVLVLFSGGTTPGKRLLGMRVISREGLPATLGRMLARELFGKAISAASFGLGCIGILMDRERRALHDRVAGTYVIG